MPKYSILIPIYNEEEILKKNTITYIRKLKKVRESFEIIFSENGSTDNTKQILYNLKKKHNKIIRVLTSDQPNYGLALKKAILKARGEFIVCEELDLCNINFFKTSTELLKSKKFDIIIGSKNLSTSNDERPLSRRIASKVFSKILFIFFGFNGTDTHGLKAFNRKIIPFAKKTKLDKDMFTTEMVIRIYNSKLNYYEVPISLKESRITPIALKNRVYKVLLQLFKLLIIKIKYGLR
jgi:glycosyltransferase involved in cell wall biosynthesis